MQNDFIHISQAYALVVQAICCFANLYKFESWIVKTVVQPLGWWGSQLNAKKFIFSWNSTVKLEGEEIHNKHLFLYVNKVLEKARRCYKHVCSLIFKDLQKPSGASLWISRSYYYFLIMYNHNRESLLLNLFWLPEL